MEKVLVIEDEARIVRLIRDYLEKEDYKVVDARDGEEGLVAFERQEPALIILDLMLPKKDGLEVAKEIRKESQVPIIMLTAKTEEADRDLRLLPYLLSYLEAVLFRQHQVQNYQSRLLALKSHQTFFPVSGVDDFIIFLFQVIPDQPDNPGLVLDHEYFLHLNPL